MTLDEYAARYSDNPKNLPVKYERYPPDDGAFGGWFDDTLEPGTVVDRYGTTSKTSIFASPVGTDDKMRSLLEGTNTKIHEYFQITQQIRVKGSIIAPWNGQPGGGIQYKFPIPIKELIDKGFIKQLQ